MMYPQVLSGGFETPEQEVRRLRWEVAGLRQEQGPTLVILSQGGGPT